MTIVMIMSTDADIVATTLNAGWNPIAQRYTWAQVQPMNLGIPNGSTIVVIAHGHDAEIGNKTAGTGVDVNATTFLDLIQGNMAAHATPARVYISACTSGIAGFAAAVSIAAHQKNMWSNVEVYGPTAPVVGPVPPAANITWARMYV